MFVIKQISKDLFINKSGMRVGLVALDKCTVYNTIGHAKRALNSPNMEFFLNYNYKLDKTALEIKPVTLTLI